MLQDARAIVEAAGECFNAEEYDRLDQLVSPDMANHAAGPHGREGWKQIWRAIHACFAGARAETHPILADGDRVAVHLTIHGTHRDSARPLLAGIAPTGKCVRWEFIHLFRVADGQIVEHFAVRDDLGLLRQLQGT